MAASNLSREEANLSVNCDYIESYGICNFWVGEGHQRLGTLGSRTKYQSRADFYVAGQFFGASGDGSDTRNVAYGRALKIFQYPFFEPSTLKDECIILSNSVPRTPVNRYGQVYQDGDLRNAFSQPTLQPLEAILNVAGANPVATEHTYPRVGNHSNARGTKVFFIDVAHRLHNLLDDEIISPDGVNRVIFGLR